MVSLSGRLLSIETETRRRRRERIAQAIACTEGIAVEEARSWVAETEAKEATIRREYQGDPRDVEQLTRWLARRHDLSEAETAQAVEHAVRVVELLEREEA